MSTDDTKQLYESRLEQVQNHLKEECEKSESLSRQVSQMKKQIFQNEETVRSKDMELESMRSQLTQVVMEVRMRKD